MKAVLLGLLVVAACWSAASAADDTLTVTQDESSMERAIERYLKNTYAAPVEAKELAEGDVALIVPMEGKGGPDFGVVVDTQASNRAEDGKVLERVVSVQVYTGVKVPDERRGAVLEALNRFLAGMWFASIYIDEDKELSCQWCVNVMKEGLPTEYVADAIIRVADSWRKFRPEAEKALGAEG